MGGFWGGVSGEGGGIGWLGSLGLRFGIFGFDGVGSGWFWSEDVRD